MRHALNNTAWKSLLPDVCDWLETVKVNTSTAAPVGVHSVVGVKPNEENKDQFSVDATKLGEVGKKLESAARALGWRPGAGPLHLTEAGTNYTLVPRSGVRAHARQVARQLGLDAAKATKDLKISQLCLCPGEGMAALEVLDGYISGLYQTVGFKGNRKKDQAAFPSTITLYGESVSADQIAEQLELAKAQALAPQPIISLRKNSPTLPKKWRRRVGSNAKSSTKKR